MEEMEYYILFSNHDNGMRLHRALKSRGFKAVIAPTPRSLSKCCGISLKIEAGDCDAAAKCAGEENIPIIEIAGIAKNSRADRDRYC